ncbi:lactate dehydrogenase/glycoside hydrolase [Aspergillus foveolatus]|uniref:lactate dehydrogenase/glycoside hydrolase n=1 Tax=Aspergillus foveolatus TaxID=210207 RepID=UPI003CCD7FF1
MVITAGSKYLYDRCLAFPSSLAGGDGDWTCMGTGQTSMDYLYRNTSIVRSIINEMKPFRSDTVLLIVANPVDLMTSLAKELSNLPSAKVLDSGTFLDSIRLRGLLADETGLAPNSLDLYVLRTHGDSAAAACSCAAVGGVPLKEALGLEKRVEESLVEECKHRSQSIVRAKGATTFGIGSIVCSICASVLLDRHNARPVSRYQPQHGCCYQLACCTGEEGRCGDISRPAVSGGAGKDCAVGGSIE